LPLDVENYEHISCNDGWSGHTHAKPPTCTHTFAPYLLQLRDSTSKSCRPLPQANMATRTDVNITYLHSILEFRQALQLVPPQHNKSAPLDADLPPLNLTPLQVSSIEQWRNSNAVEFDKLIETTKIRLYSIKVSLVYSSVRTSLLHFAPSSMTSSTRQINPTANACIPACLRVLYAITTDDTRSKCNNIEMRIDRAVGTKTTSMEGYMENVVYCYDN